MPKVFITNKGGHDYSPAEEFGELVFITEGLFDQFNIGGMYRYAVDALSNSSEDDYILPTGLPVMNMVVALVWARLHGKANLLLFSRGSYIHRVIMLDNLL